ncbi:4Fe-4S dicluster domain-containing protein [Myxococcota bacterium]|nr:4Fe-4S dicluster domain-containing protein [Myxococcota bacterium]
MTESAKNISYLPTDGLTYDPSDAHYWKREALDQEVERVFEVCHGCRMCFKYCDSFPKLFTFIDDRHDGDVRKLRAEETREVMDACFQCKLCEVECPYTPKAGHEFKLDFPRLVHRYKAVNTVGKAKSLRDQLLGDPDGSAHLARMSFGLANAMNKVPLHRWFMEKIAGIHRDKQLPDFAPQTFSAWAEENGKTRREPKAEAVLFQTCFVENNDPSIGKDTVEVMERSKVDLACVKGLGCCGMPAWEQGDLETLRARAKHNLDILMPWVDGGAKVVVINPTCAMMMRNEYPDLLEGADRERAKRLSAAVRDAGEMLWNIRKEPRFDANFLSSPGDKVAYHAPCHLRAQRAGFKGRDLLRRIPGVEPETTLECCGHDGTYAMKVETFEDSARIGKKAFDGLKSSTAEVWATECPLAAIQFEQHAGKKALHPMTILARAYRADGFPKKLPPKE